MSLSAGIQRHDTLRSKYLEGYRLSKLNLTFLAWFTGAYWWKLRGNIQGFGYLVEEGVPRSSGLQVHVVIYSGFQSVMTQFQKKARNRFLYLFLERHFL